MEAFLTPPAINAHIRFATESSVIGATILVQGNTGGRFTETKMRHRPSHRNARRWLGEPDNFPGLSSGIKSVFTRSQMVLPDGLSDHAKITWNNTKTICEFAKTNLLFHPGFRRRHIVICHPAIYRRACPKTFSSFPDNCRERAKTFRECAKTFCRLTKTFCSLL